MESIVQQKTFQKKLENAVKDKKGRPLGEDLEELTNIVFQKLKEGKNPISSTPKSHRWRALTSHIHHDTRRRRTTLSGIT